MTGEHRKRIWLARELRELGKTERQISYAVKKGRLHRVERGVYTTEVPDDLLKLQALAAVRPGLVYSGQTAAFLYGLVELNWPAEGRVPRVSSRNGGDLLRLGSYSVFAARQLKGVPVITPVQLAVDLGGVPVDQIRWLLLQHYAGVAGNDLLARELAVLTTGREDAIALLGGVITGTASALELRAARVIRAALEDMPVTVEINQKVRGYRFDVVVKEVRVLIEIDSYAFHAGELGEKSMEEGFIRDRWKGNMATRWGWFLLRYSDDCVNFASAYMAREVADTVRFLLEHRGRRRREDESVMTDCPVWQWHPLF